MAKTTALARPVDEAKNRLPQFTEFLERVARVAKTSNPDHFFRSGKIEDRASLHELATLFLTMAMGFEKDEFIPSIGGSDAPDFVPQSEDYYPWAFFVVPTHETDLMEVFHKRAMQYLLSDAAGKKNFAVITNFRSLIVCDLKHYVEEYDLNFADLLDSIRNENPSKEIKASRRNWSRFLETFGPESAQDKKKKRRSEVISYVEPKESHLGFVKRFGNMPSFEKPIGWDGNNFHETFKTKDLPFLATEEFDWQGKVKTFNNRLIWGDNLAVMRSLPSDSIDLIYIDPPFFSGKDYNCIFGDDDEVRTFRDIWDGGLPTYLAWLNARLWEMRRLLKDTGSIFVHLDWHASHYVKVELDKIFGYDNFQNEIVWTYATGGASKERFARKHDAILFYSKTGKYKFFPDRILENRTEKSLKRAQNPNGARIAADNTKKLPTDVWQIQALNPMAVERIGYPTQKPEELVAKIILGCSNEGDCIADFFSGGGTTVTVAEKLGRRWIGCDVSRIAVSVIRDRLLSSYSKDVGVPRTAKTPATGFLVQNHGAYDKALVRSIEETDYRAFILQCYEAVPTKKGDYIHGFRDDRAVHVAPAKGKTTVDLIEEFHTELSHHKIRNGVILTWDWDREAEQFIESLRKGTNGPDIQLVQVKLLNIDSHEFKGDNIRFLNKPAAVIRNKHVSGLKWVFDGTASQGRNNVDIHYYQWDFDYSGRFTPMTKPNFKNDEDGDGNPLNDTRRVEYTFPKPGKYKIALRIIDKSGAEAIDVTDIDVGKASEKAA